jgi:flagellar assembly protein FliH
LSDYARGYLHLPRRATEILLDLDGLAVNRERAFGPLVPVDDPEALARARVLVEAAQAEAAAIVVQAVTDASAMQHDAYRDGREAGYRDGVVEARGELADAMSLLQHALREAHAIHDRLLRNTEREVIELVIDVARSVLGAQVALEPTLVLDTVERALQRAGAQNVVRVRVHPDDHSVVSAGMAERHGEVVPFAVLNDHTVAVGGCVIDTAAGEIDARLDVQLDEIARLLRSAMPDTQMAGAAA